ncbi:hypothetical protein Syun_029718 [Stephania yunnanensis]|uniref:Uncharacterized protein n=1 Tax=Stephania yunnanensis TaxID=152371 RepID=A0AAP0EEE9_9MAGN
MGSRSSSEVETTTSQRQASGGAGQSGGDGQNAVEPKHNPSAPFPGGPFDYPKFLFNKYPLTLCESLC